MKKYWIIILLLLCMLAGCGREEDYEPMKPEDREGFEKISAEHTIIDEDVSTYLLIKNKPFNDQLLYSITLYMNFEKGNRTSRYHEYYQMDYYLENDVFGTHYHDFDRIDGAKRNYGQNFMPYYNLGSDIKYFNFLSQYSFMMKDDSGKDILYEKELKYKEEIIKFEKDANYVAIQKEDNNEDQNIEDQNTENQNKFDFKFTKQSIEGEKYNRYKLNIYPKFEESDEFVGHLDIQCFIKCGEDIYPYLGLYHYNIVNGNYVTVSDELLDKTYNIEKLYFIINKYEINNPNVEKFYYTLDV